jgi:hypothetical protein
MKYAEGLYRHLLGTLPEAFRKEYEEAMVQLFRDLCRDAADRRGFAGLVAVWGFLLKDLTGSLIREHRAEGRKAMRELWQNVRRKLANDWSPNNLLTSLLGTASTAILVLGIFKLTSLPLTEGQLFIGILVTLAVSLQFVILAVLVAPAKVVKE